MVPLHVQLVNSTLRRVIKRLHFPLEIMLVCVRWYAAYPLSLRNLEEMMAERGVLVDHATVHRWALKMLPVLAAVFRRRKLPVGKSWRVTIDKSGANTAAVRGLMADSGLTVELRQSKYLNNVVEQDHRAIKRRTRPMMGFKSFGSAVKIIAGVETMHMVKKGQLRCPGGLAFSTADYFYSLATK
jgi:putative transposase